MTDPAVDALRVRSPRLDEDEIELTALGRRERDGITSHVSAYRHCDRAREDQELSETVGEQIGLTEATDD